MTASGEPDLRRALEAVRERLGALADRVGRARAVVDTARKSAPHAPAGETAPAPFGGADARPIDDVELTFRAVDIDAGGDAGSDQDKAR